MPMRKWIDLINEAANEAVIQSPEFKDWFRSSKVVDQSGKPLVLYHGTENFDFDEGDGLFSAFGYDHATQSGFSFSNKPEIAAAFTSVYGATIPVYLRIERPLVVDAEEVMHDDGWGLVHNNDAKDELIWRAREQGYDGIIIRGIPEQVATGDEYIVFEPTQIKSAVGNRSFRSDDPRFGV